MEPNVKILPYVEKLNGISYVIVEAVKNIEKDEQLFISYGSLGNTHLI